VRKDLRTAKIVLGAPMEVTTVTIKVSLVVLFSTSTSTFAGWLGPRSDHHSVREWRPHG
jgi:hypothetical protein